MDFWVQDQSDLRNSRTARVTKRNPVTNQQTKNKTLKYLFSIQTLPDPREQRFSPGFDLSPWENSIILQQDKAMNSQWDMVGKRLLVYALLARSHAWLLKLKKEFARYSEETASIKKCGNPHWFFLHLSPPKHHTHRINKTWLTMKCHARKMLWKRTGKQQRLLKTKTWTKY